MPPGEPIGTLLPSAGMTRIRFKGFSPKRVSATDAAPPAVVRVVFDCSCAPKVYAE